MKGAVIVSILLFLAIFSTIIALIPSTDDFAPDNPLWNGLSIFVSTYKPVLVKAIEASSLPPRVTLLIIGPSLPFTKAEVRSIMNFVKRGGTLILMDDYGSGNELLKLMGIRIRLLHGVLRDPLFRYKASFLPRVKIVGGGYLVLNYGTALKLGEGQCLAWSSHFSYLDVNNNGVHDPGEPVGPLCVAAIVRRGKGEIVVIADSSLLINAMIGMASNGKFVSRFIKGKVYLVADKWRKGTYTIVRESIVNMVSTIMKSSYRYPTTLYVSLAVFFVVCRIWKNREKRVRKREELINSIVRNLVSKHPEWDPENVWRIVAEVVEHD